MTTKQVEFPENKIWEGESQYKFLGKRHDPRFGDISILENKRNKSRIMLKEKQSGDKNQFHRDISMASQRMLLQNDNLHQMLAWGTMTKKELCSTHHYVRMFFGYPGSDLRNEVAEKKKKSNELLPDKTLSIATSNALHGLDYLHVKNLAHGDIRPQLISAEKIGNVTSPNHFKLLDRLNDPSPIERAQINNVMNNKELFMSPQLYKRINTRGKNKPSYNRQKNDLFALGMSIISAGNAKSVKNCYKKGGDFDKVKLKEHLGHFCERNKANFSLCNVVTNLVEYEEDVRPDTAMLLGRTQHVVKNVPAPEEVVHTEIVETVQTPVQPVEHVVETVHHTDGFFDRPKVEYVQNAPPVEPMRKSYIKEIKEGPSKIQKTGENVIIGEPKIMRTYVDESSRRSYRGQDRSSLIAPKSPRNKLNNFNPEQKQAMVVRAEDYMKVPLVEKVGVNEKLVKRTVVVKDDKGLEIDRVEENIQEPTKP